MKLAVKKADFESLLSRATRATDSKSALAVLSHVALVATGRELRAMGTDLYVGFTGAAEAVIEQDGACLVPANELLSRVQSMPDGPISIETVQNKLRVAAKSRKHLLPTLPPESYPRFDKQHVSPSEFSVTARDFKAGLDRVYRVVDPKGAAHLTGVHVWIEKGRIFFGGFSSHRCHIASFASEAPEMCDRNTILPLPAVEDLRATLGMVAADSMVEVIRSDLIVEARDASGARTTITPIYYDTAPFFRLVQTILHEPKHPVQVPRALAAEVVKAIGGSDESGGVDLIFRAGRMYVESHGADGRHSQDEVPVDYDGPERKITILSKYVEQMLSAAPSDFVTVEPRYYAEGFDPFVKGADLRGASRDASMLQGGLPEVLVFRAGDFAGNLMPMMPGKKS